VSENSGLRRIYGPEEGRSGRRSEHGLRVSVAQKRDEVVGGPNMD
jgi:hypothetical protein